MDAAEPSADGAEGDGLDDPVAGDDVVTVVDDELDDPVVEALAEELFGDRLALAHRYAEHLASTGVEWGLIGPREVPRLWRRHLLNCALACGLLPDRARVLDIGSGAGLPGMVWAIARPDLRIALVEPLERRTRWLDLVVEDLDLDVRVVRARAEELTRVAPELIGAEVVTARAVASLAKLVGWTVPLMGPQGQVLALKGASAAAEIERDARALRRARVTAELVECGSWAEEPTRVVRLTRAARR